MTMPSDGTPMKRCPQCEQEFPATKWYFPSSPTGRDGLNPRCKPCVSRNNGHAPRPLLDPVPEGFKRCYICKEVFSATAENFYPTDSSKMSKDGLQGKCKKCRSEGRKRDYRESIEHHAVVLQNYREKNKEQRRTYNNEYTRTHKEQIHEYQRQYNLTHRESYRARDRRRQAIKMAVPGTHTAEQIREQYDRQKGKCYYCRNKVKWGNHHVDHTFPLSRVVGTGIPANDISYLVIACKHCNLTKHDRFPWEWPEGGRLL